MHNIERLLFLTSLKATLHYFCNSELFSIHCQLDKDALQQNAKYYWFVLVYYHGQNAGS